MNILGIFPKRVWLCMKSWVSLFPTPRWENQTIAVGLGMIKQAMN